jgi:hypothetical protein
MTDKESKLLSDVISDDKVSNCCGAKVYAPTDDWAICMDCKEHCDAVSEEVDLFKQEQLIQHWDKSNVPAGHKGE